jgi:primosomal protein N' (replication factor Y)
VPDCRWCGRLATDTTCAACGSHEITDVAPGSTWTADIIGKSFPNVAIVVSDGERIVTSIAPTPQIVIATPGAEPFCSGGYSTVIILDAERQLYSDKMRVVENALRLWAHAIGCCAPTGRVFVQGAGGRLGAVLGSRTWCDYMKTEVAERAQLHLPPSSRMAHLTGHSQVVRRALDALPDAGVYSILGPMPDGDGQVRATVLFSYARGSDVTQSLRASVVAAAAARKRPGSTPALRVRLDDAHVSGHVS